MTLNDNNTLILNQFYMLYIWSTFDRTDSTIHAVILSDSLIYIVLSIFTDLKLECIIGQNALLGRSSPRG